MKCTNIIYQIGREMDISPILEMLREKIGLSPESIGEKHIRKAIFNRMSASSTATVAEYKDLVTASQIELNELINLVVIPETWFFRDKVPFDALADYVKTKWLPQCANKRLNILSLPCATGEEPYSIAMILLELGMSPKQFAIDAIDISDRVIDIAKAGIYSEYSFRGEDIVARSKYFDPHESGYKLHDNVRETVKFKIGNLFDEQLSNMSGYYQILFCRNLLIYFDRSAKDKAIKVLYRLLRTDGVLFVGLAETARLSLWGFNPLDFPQSFAYLKVGANVINAATLNDVIAGAELPKSAITENNNQLYENSVRVAKEKSGKIPTNSARGVAEENIALINKNNSVSEAVDVEAKIAEITALADKGMLQEAEKLCEQLLSANYVSAQLYYLMGNLANSSDNVLLSEEYFMRAIYLDPNHHDALMQLYTLSEIQGNKEKASMYRRRAERVIQRKTNQ
ncbi:MAG: hypothetical protein A2V90_00940 [Gammaproteobacteria bacterium RBG_16_57_12]|nr:MAG: hypothetical protein A2V90_00940 [Gammaproteobacteria bacterium RBG_16_57_12]